MKSTIITTEINIIVYALSSISKDEERAKAEKLSELISQVFQCEEKKENIMKTYLEEPQLDKDISFVGDTKLIKYSICKNESKIQIGTININDEDEDKEYKSYELMGKLKSLMNTLFKMKLANNDEPILLSGPTGYKTFVSKKILYDPDVVALNQESTISQLLGSSFFYSIPEDRKFCLKYIYLILVLQDKFS